MNDYLMALIGGGLIGISASLFLLFKGRVLGVSGILGGIIAPQGGGVIWKGTMVLGFVFGGAVASLFLPDAFPQIEISNGRLIAAGLLVGFGTQIGSGCTSGHGVCGMSRISFRSIVATAVFMGFRILTVAIAS